MKFICPVCREEFDISKEHVIQSVKREVVNEKIKELESKKQQIEEELHKLEKNIRERDEMLKHLRDVLGMGA